MTQQEFDSPAAAERLPDSRLTGLTESSLAIVVDVVAQPADAVRLKSLGVCVGRRVQLVKSGDPLIIRVLGARVGLSARLAAGVVVRTLK